MNDSHYTYNLSTAETDHNKSMDIETKTPCPFSGQFSRTSALEMPKGHEKYAESDKEKCPVMSGMIQLPTQTAEKANTLSEEPVKKKEKKPKGGCPFMASDNKKPPALEPYPAAYEIKYTSAMGYMLKYKASSNSIANIPEDRRWENLPIFLKHTLFHDEEKMDAFRKLELGQRFFIFDKFREQANKAFNKGRYEEAIGLYEHALSCVKWLKYKDIKMQKGKKAEPEAEISMVKDEPNLEEEKEIRTDKSDIDGESTTNSVADKEEEKEEEKDPYEDLKPINKALLKPLTDENIEVFDGEGVEDDADKDMRNSMLIIAYHGLAVCYMRLHHYSIALRAIEEGLKVNETSSQLHYRRSQARAFNKGSTLEDIIQAKQDIEKAIELKANEKIFKNEPGVLKVLNVHNADEAYQHQLLYTEAILKEKRQEATENIRAIMTKVREIEFLEDAFRKEGKKVPFENDNLHAVDININDDDQMEYDVTNEIVKKYNQLIEFYQGTERKDQVEIAKKEIQTALEISAKMKFYRDLDFNQWEQNEIIKEALNDIKLDMSNKRVLERLRRFKNERSKELFENGNFNMEVYQYALRDYLKRKEENEQKQKKGKSTHDEIEPKKNRVSLFGYEIGFHTIAFAFVLLVVWYLNKKSLLPTGLLWSDQNKGSFV